jgi:phosphoribosylanthranilate isomerase
MKGKTYVKICGVHNIKEAKKAEEYGADYIGLLVDFPNTYLSLSRGKARSIIKSIKTSKPIILTLEREAEKVIRLIEETNPWGIQLLRPSENMIKKLKKNKDSAKYVRKYKKSDFLLLDSKKGRLLGGTGKVHDWKLSKNIIEKSPVPVFLAGGLSVANVEKAISLLKPYAVDVESSLRNKNGFRDLNKVKRFIKKVKNLY